MSARIARRVPAATFRNLVPERPDCPIAGRAPTNNSPHFGQTPFSDAVWELEALLYVRYWRRARSDRAHDLRSSPRAVCDSCTTGAHTKPQRRDTLVLMKRSPPARMLLTCLTLVLGGACGKHGSKPKDGNGSGAEASDWKFFSFVAAPRNQLAVVIADGKAALVNGDGQVISPIKIASDEIVAKGNGEMVLLAAGASFHAIGPMGHEIWTRTILADQADFGDSTFATAGADGSAVVALASGRSLYEEAHPSNRVYRTSNGYLFASNDELWFVDEATGKKLWRRSIADLGRSALSRGNSSLVVLRPDRTFQELDYSQGKLLADGTCEGEAPTTPAKPSECAGFPKIDLGKDTATLLARIPGGGDYYLLAKDAARQPVQQLIARDVVGRSRWMVPWPEAAGGVLEGPPLTDNASQLIAFVDTYRSRTMLVFDNTNGKLEFTQPLEPGERLVGLYENCWLIVRADAIICVDARTGADTWEVSTSGGRVEAWPLAGGEVLLLDGNPPTLSRIGRDGHRRWQTELVEAADRDRWHFSDTLGIGDVAGKLSVINLKSGRLAQVH